MNGDPKCLLCCGVGHTIDFDAAIGGASMVCSCCVPFMRAEYFDHAYPNYVGRPIIEDEHNLRSLSLLRMVQEKGGNAYIHGLPGRGKTFPSWSTMRAISTSPPHHRGVIIHHPTWIAALTATNADGYEGPPAQAIQQAAQAARVLLIDDFSGGKGLGTNARRPSDYQIEQTYLLLDERIRHPERVTIATSNLAPSQWKQLWEERVSSRLNGLFANRRVQVVGPDRRGRGQ